MLSLARVVSQFPAQYFGKLPGLFLTFESLLGFREFFPRFFARFTSRRLRSLFGQLSFLLVPNMVLSKMNNHEHGTRQTYESYTFQPLMSFCLYLKSGVPQFTLQFDF